MRELLLRPLALADLEGIWAYTYDRWGEEQASRYLLKLDKQMESLASRPEQGKCIQGHPGFRALRIGRHVTIYTHTETQIGIERVLHDQMDAARHL